MDVSCVYSSRKHAFFLLRTETKKVTDTTINIRWTFDGCCSKTHVRALQITKSSLHAWVHLARRPWYSGLNLLCFRQRAELICRLWMASTTSQLGENLVLLQYTVNRRRIIAEGTTLHNFLRAARVQPAVQSSSNKLLVFAGSRGRDILNDTT